MTSAGTDTFEHTKYRVGNTIYPTYELALLASIMQRNATIDSSEIEVITEFEY